MLTFRPEGQALDRMKPFLLQIQRRARRHQQPQVRGSREQFADVIRGVEQLLEIIEHQQHALAANVLQQLLCRRNVGQKLVLQLSGQGGYEAVEGIDRGEWYKQHAVGKLIGAGPALGDGVRRAQRQLSFADAAGAG